MAGNKILQIILSSLILYLTKLPAPVLSGSVEHKTFYFSYDTLQFLRDPVSIRILLLPMTNQCQLYKYPVSQPGVMTLWQGRVLVLDREGT